MKNRVVSVLLLILCIVFCLSGCSLGNYFENGKPSSNGGAATEPGQDPETPPDEPGTVSTHYTVRVFFNNEPYSPGDNDVTVVWRNRNEVKRVMLGSDGKADAGELSGTYSVYLSGLPEEYTYDPNGYVATASERQVSVLLVSVSTPDRGDGSTMYVNTGCFSMRHEGTYRAVIAGENKSLFYEYKPISSGIYVIESWVNIYDDEVNPLLHLYNGSTQMKWFARTLDGGGAASDGGFSKNFRYEYAVAQNEVGGVCTFAVGGVSKTQEYPLYVDFCIKYIGEYTSSYADIRPQAAKEARGKTPEPKPNETFYGADMGTKLFDASRYALSDNTGKYHRYDPELYKDNPYGYGVGYGPMLMCAITAAMPAYTVVSSLYEANSVGLNKSNYLMLYNIWIEDEQKFATFDYTNFIRIDYYGVRNSRGYCYVTEELRKFLQKFAENHSLYTDGVGPGIGTPEAGGYSANQDALWLFACGFYE